MLMTIFQYLQKEGGSLIDLESIDLFIKRTEIPELGTMWEGDLRPEDFYSISIGTEMGVWAEEFSLYEVI